MIELIKGLISKLAGLLTGKQNTGTATAAGDSTKVEGQTSGKVQDNKWKHYIAYVFVGIVVYNVMVIPVLALFGIVLPPVVLDEVWKILVILLSGV